MRVAKIITSILSGIMLALSFPKADLSLFAWLALFPLFFLFMKSEPLHALGYGFLFGEAFFIFLLYWILILLMTQTEMGAILSLFVFLLFTSLLSLFPALLGYMASKAQRSFGPRAIFCLPVFWVALDFLRNDLFGGFPWGFIGYSQSSYLSFIQIVSITGIYGVSFLLVFCNASISYLFLERKKRFSWFPLLLLIIIILISSGWGDHVLSHRKEKRGEEISVACIQGNYGTQTRDEIPQGTILSDYMDMTIRAAQMGSSLIVWPESTTYYEICCTEGYADLLSQLCREQGIDMILGSVHRVQHSHEEIYLNSAFHIDASGKVAERYDKIHLVPYGEYVPFPRLLFFIKRFVEAVGDFSKGEEYVVMDYRGYPFSVLICYEVIFPDHVRAFVRNGASFFINITNDSWFGRSAAPYQHFQFLIFRAIETGRFFIRCASTGISGIISPHGEVLSATEIFTKGMVKGSIKPNKEDTFYDYAGDWFALACAIISIIIIILLWDKGAKTGKRWKGVQKL